MGVDGGHGDPGSRHSHVLPEEGVRDPHRLLDERRGEQLQGAPHRDVDRGEGHPQPVALGPLRLAVAVVERLSGGGIEEEGEAVTDEDERVWECWNYHQ